MIRRTITIATVGVMLLAPGMAAIGRPLKPAEEAAIRPAGKPVDCIPISRIDHSRVRDDRTIDFYMRGRNQVYRNRLPQSCPELGFEERFGYETSIDQLCSVDIITVLHDASPIRGASCGLGSFQPITGAPRD